MDPREVLTSSSEASGSGEPSPSNSSASSSSATTDAPSSAGDGFRVVIVGGGPCGLAMAHALAKAGIDYVLLERSPAVVNSDGASIALWPHSVRLLDQLGLFEAADDIFVRVTDKYNVLEDGTIRDKNDMFRRIEAALGHPWMLFRRTKLLRILYERLPERESRVRTGMAITRIDTHADGVSVVCKDGTVVGGSVVVGCDGVHSKVRQLLRENQLRAGEAPSDGERPMKTTYNGLVGLCPLPAGVPAGTIWETRGNRRSLHILAGHDEAYFIVYSRLAEARRERVRYTDADAEAMARDFAGFPVTGTLQFGAMWGAKTWAKLVDFEEGFLNKWHGERVVLVGDAVHKATPNAGLSLNTGWQGVAELTNRLRRLLLQDACPGAKALAGTFAEYQRARQGPARGAMLLSEVYTRMVARENLLYRLADWLSPKVNGDALMLDHVAGPMLSRAVTFDFLDEPHYKQGRIPWKNKPRARGEAGGEAQAEQ